MSDCVYSWPIGQFWGFSFALWSACSKECNGTQYRDPVITAQPVNGGLACPGRQTQSCGTDCTVKLFSGCGFTGARQGQIAPGWYPSPNNTRPPGYGFQDRGGAVGNDDLRSIQVPSGLKATIYEDVNYGGGSLGAWTIYGSDPTQKNRNFCATDGWWVDQMSSIKVDYE